MSGVAALLPGLGLFGTLFAFGKQKPTNGKRKAYRWVSLLGLLLFVSVIALGCGGSSSNHSTTTPASSSVTLMVTGTSGSLSHSTPVTVTIN